MYYVFKWYNTEHRIDTFIKSAIKIRGKSKKYEMIWALKKRENQTMGILVISYPNNTTNLFFAFGLHRQHKTR